MAQVDINNTQYRSEATTRNRQYRYAMISSEIRRDLQAPLCHFKRLKIYHLYRSAPWNDMKEDDFDSRTMRFHLPPDLYWNLHKIKPEIIQGPEPFSLLMLPYLIITLFYLWLHPRVKLVTLSLEPIPLGKKYSPIIVPFYRQIMRWWFRRAVVIFWFDTGSYHNLLANGAPKDKLVNIIYGCWGIDLDEFSPKGASIPIPSNEPIILYVGRLHPVKGVNYLLEAYSMLLKQGLKCHLVIVGDGQERTNLVNLARQLKINDLITWYGTIKNADLPPYMRCAKMLVLPSITTKMWVQQLSVTAWQAMGCGLPVIATNTGGMAEFTPTDTGILVPERDMPALVNAIKELLLNPSKREFMARQARAYAVSRFNIKQNVQIAEQTILEWCTTGVAENPFI